MREKSALFPQVAHGSLRPRVAAEQQPATEQDHANHRNHFNDGEPELHLTEHFHIGQVDSVNHHEEDGSRSPGRKVWPPELDIFANGGEFRHGDQHIEHPVVPARGEACKVAPVFIREVAEAAGDRLFHDHFA